MADLKNFTKFTVKQLRWRSLFGTAAILMLQRYWKKVWFPVFSCEFWFLQKDYRTLVYSQKQSPGGVLYKKLFLKVLQNSQENNFWSHFLQACRVVTLLKRNSSRAVLVWVLRNFYGYLLYNTSQSDYYFRIPT